MDFFQGVVTEFLRADRSVFVNSELLIQIDPGDSPEKGRYWYCDAVAVNFRESKVYLCEVTYSSGMSALLKRLSAWNGNWPGIRAAIARDCAIPADWPVVPWVFIPEERGPAFARRVSQLSLGIAEPPMPSPRVTWLESVVPWKYRSWDRKVDALEDG